jgi:hypothetical protein
VILSWPTFGAQADALVTTFIKQDAPGNRLSSNTGSTWIKARWRGQ